VQEGLHRVLDGLRRLMRAGGGCAERCGERDGGGTEAKTHGAIAACSGGAGKAATIAAVRLEAAKKGGFLPPYRPSAGAIGDVASLAWKLQLFPSSAAPPWRSGA
jgi:hypothetical protein